MLIDKNLPRPERRRLTRAYAKGRARLFKLHDSGENRATRRAHKKNVSRQARPTPKAIIERKKRVRKSRRKAGLKLFKFHFSF